MGWYRDDAPRSRSPCAALMSLKGSTLAEQAHTSLNIDSWRQEEIMAATDRFEIPTEMRNFAEKSVEQAKQAFDSFISAAHQAVTVFEGQAESARKGAMHVTEKAMNFAEQNVARSFEFAQQLVRAKDVQELLKLQAEYIRSQMQFLSEQAKELGETPNTPKR
jgi:phasin